MFDNIPCEKCILFPKCLQKVDKEILFSKEMTKDYPNIIKCLYPLINKCSILRDSVILHVRFTSFSISEKPNDISYLIFSIDFDNLCRRDPDYIIKLRQVFNLYLPTKKERNK